MGEIASLFVLLHRSRLQLRRRAINTRRRLADPAGKEDQYRGWVGSVFRVSLLCSLALLSAPGGARAATSQSPLPPLHAAVEKSDYRAALDLLRVPGALDSSGPSGDTALHYAARRGTPLMVSLLLAYGADPQALNDAGGNLPKTNGIGDALK